MSCIIIEFEDQKEKIEKRLRTMKYALGKPRSL